jgi:hypothetical protein
MRSASCVDASLSDRDSARSANRGFFIRVWSNRRCSIAVPALIIFTFSLLYLLASRYYHYTSYCDPTSYFDPRRAYERLCSSHRLGEAEAYIYVAGDTVRPVRSSVETPLMCVGIAAVAQRGYQYVSLTVGSLLAGLNNEERTRICLEPLIGHIEPSHHLRFVEKWAETLPDRILEDRNGSADFRSDTCMGKRRLVSKSDHM